MNKKNISNFFKLQFTTWRPPDSIARTSAMTCSMRDAQPSDVIWRSDSNNNNNNINKPKHTQMHSHYRESTSGRLRRMLRISSYSANDITASIPSWSESIQLRIAPHHNSINVQIMSNAAVVCGKRLASQKRKGFDETNLVHTTTTLVAQVGNRRHMDVRTNLSVWLKGKWKLFRKCLNLNWTMRRMGMCLCN